MQKIRTWIKKINWEAKYNILREGAKWFFFQVFACMIPMLVGIGFALFLGYEVDIVKIFPDFLLAAFAIGMNLWGFEIRRKKKVPVVIRDFYQMIVFCISSVSAVLYIGLFNDGYVAENIKIVLQGRNIVMKIMIGAFCVLMVVDVILAGISARIEQKNLIKKEVLNESGML